MSSDDASYRTLSSSQTRLLDWSLTAVVADHLDCRRDAVERELSRRVLAEIPAFTESHNPDVLGGMAEHAPEHTEELIRLLRGGAVGDFAFVHEHAVRRAQQHFPLEATLHAYRCGHKVYAHVLREAALAIEPVPSNLTAFVAAIAEFTIEYTDAISTVAAAAYVAEVRRSTEVAVDQRIQLLNLLLEGHDESDGRTARLLRDAGYLDRRQRFCVVLARSVDAAEMQYASRARRIVDALDQCVKGLARRCVVDVRDGKVTAVLSDPRRASGWTAPRAELAERVADALPVLGLAVLAGVSNDVPSTAHIPNAFCEAELALELASVSRRVVCFGRIPPSHLLLQIAGDRFEKVLPQWSQSLSDADQRSGGELVQTLRAYADADMNALKAARNLEIHPNTLHARLQRIHEASGLDARRFHELTQLLLISDCLK